MIIQLRHLFDNSIPNSRIVGCVAKAVFSLFCFIFFLLFGKIIVLLRLDNLVDCI